MQVFSTAKLVSGRAIQYDIPVMKSQTYTINEIFEKKLLLLIPFHIFSYEGHFQEYNEDDTQVNNLMEDYRGSQSWVERCLNKFVMVLLHLRKRLEGCKWKSRSLWTM